MKSIYKAVQKMLQVLALYNHRYKSRKVLKQLSQHQLSDIGISQEQVTEEANRPFWVGGSNLFASSSTNTRVNKNVQSCVSENKNQRNQFRFLRK